MALPLAVDVVALPLAVDPELLHPAVETTNNATKKTPMSVITERLSHSYFHTKIPVILGNLRRTINASVSR